MLEINALRIRYGSNEVLKQLSLSLPSAQIHGIVGMNGAGKTTLFKAIAGYNRSFEGSILFDGSLIPTDKVALLETSPFFYSRINGGDYLDLFRVNNPHFALEKWQETFSLPLNRLVETYSTGMKKKLAFLGILALNRPLLLLDEPFNGIDLESNEKIKQVLKALKQKGFTILLSSHILEALTTIADTISYLDQGVIQQTSFPDQYGQLSMLLHKNTNEEYGDWL